MFAGHGETGRDAFERRPFRPLQDAGHQPVYVAESRTRIRSPGRDTILIQIHAPRAHPAKTGSASTDERAVSRSARSNPEFIRVAYSRTPAEFSPLLRAGHNGFRSDPSAHRLPVTERSPGRRLVNALFGIAWLAWAALLICVLSSLLVRVWLE
jgi:hypothetical protein